IAQRAHQQCLAQTRDSFEEHVATREQCDEDLAHHLVLADDGLAQLGFDLCRALDECGDRLAVELVASDLDVEIGHAAYWPSRSAKYCRTSSRTIGDTVARST